MKRTILTGILFLSSALFLHASPLRIAEFYVIQPGDNVAHDYPPMPAVSAAFPSSEWTGFVGPAYITGIHVSAYWSNTYCGQTEIIVRRSSDQALVYYKVITAGDETMMGTSFSDNVSFQPDSIFIGYGDALAFEIAAFNSQPGAGTGVNISITFPYRLVP